MPAIANRITIVLAVAALAAIAAADASAGSRVPRVAAAPHTQAAGSFKLAPTERRSLAKLNLKAAPMGAARWANVLSAATDTGLVPVTIALDVDAHPEGALSPADAEAQRAEIAAAVAQVRRAVRGTGSGTVTSTGIVPFASVLATPTALRRIRTLDVVLAASEDVAVAAPPTGTSANESLAARWDYTRIGVGTSTAGGWTGSGQSVAVFDSGVDFTHPYLAGRMLDESCYSSVAYAGDQAICPNGVTKLTAVVGAARPCLGAAATTTNCGHGTHVAHTAAGLYGVAPAAKIIAANVFHYGRAATPTGWGITSYYSDRAWAYKRVYDLSLLGYKIAAVNISIGGGGYTGYCDNANADTKAEAAWIATLYSRGIATVISSGNDNYMNAVGSPGCISQAITVGNSTLDALGNDAVYSGTKYGSNSAAMVDLLAPGTSIWSALPGATTAQWTGTSMAAPQVTGAIAVLRQMKPASIPALLTALQASGTPVTDSRNGITRSRIHLVNAEWYLYNH